MKNKITRILKNPRYALYAARSRLQLFTSRYRLFALDEQYRSDSENGMYSATVTRTLSNQRRFETFKRDPAYQQILEHVSREQGEEYLKILRPRADGVLEAALRSVLVTDSVGSPVKFIYSGIELRLSPTTLRYVKVASDLKRLFGMSIGSVAEIGCGYGGQCVVSEKLLGYKRFTLLDLPFVNLLIKRYIDYTLFDGSYRTATINELEPAAYDLAVSNYAFSELPAPLQRVYIAKVLAMSARGYLTMNSGIGGFHEKGKLTLEELRGLLPPFQCLEENPLTAPYNYIIVWGHDASKIDGWFSLRQFT